MKFWCCFSIKLENTNALYSLEQIGVLFTFWVNLLGIIKDSYKIKRFQKVWINHVIRSITGDKTSQPSIILSTCVFITRQSIDSIHSIHFLDRNLAVNKHSIPLRNYQDCNIYHLAQENSPWLVRLTQPSIWLPPTVRISGTCTTVEIITTLSCLYSLYFFVCTYY